MLLKNGQLSGAPRHGFLMWFLPYRYETAILVGDEAPQAVRNQPVKVLRT